MNVLSSSVNIDTVEPTAIETIWLDDVQALGFGICYYMNLGTVLCRITNYIIIIGSRSILSNNIPVIALKRVTKELMSFLSACEFILV